MTASLFLETLLLQPNHLMDSTTLHNTGRRSYTKSVSIQIFEFVYFFACESDFLLKISAIVIVKLFVIAL